jgi:hypothetical protein
MRALAGCCTIIEDSLESSSRAIVYFVLHDTPRRYSPSALMTAWSAPPVLYKYRHVIGRSSVFVEKYIWRRSLLPLATF